MLALLHSRHFLDEMRVGWAAHSAFLRNKLVENTNGGAAVNFLAHKHGIEWFVHKLTGCGRWLSGIGVEDLASLT